MTTVKMMVEYIIEFAGTDDEIGELSLEGDVLHGLIGNGRWHEDGWRVWGARIVGEVQEADVVGLTLREDGVRPEHRQGYVE